LEANGLCSEVFQDIHQLLLSKTTNQTRTPRLFAVVYHGSAGVYQSHGVGTQEADGRNQGATNFVGAKGLGTKWACGFLRKCLKVVNLETSKKSLPTTAKLGGFVYNQWFR